MFMLVFDKDDEFMATLLEFAKQEELAGSYFTGLGAFSDVTFGFFERKQKDYLRIEINEQVEVMSLIGNIAATDDGPRIHAHVVVGKRDGTAHGGHLLKAHVWPTLELTLPEASTQLRRVLDDETNLPLIAL
jgi:predicted DNA-binding protein with PD1-like motif